MYVFILPLWQSSPHQTERIDLQKEISGESDDLSGDDDDEPLCDMKVSHLPRVNAARNPYDSLLACTSSVDSVRLFMDFLDYDASCFTAKHNRFCVCTGNEMEHAYQTVNRIFGETGEQLYNNVLFFDTYFLRPFGYRLVEHPASTSDLNVLSNRRINFERYVIVAISTQGFYAGHVYLWSADSWYIGKGDDRRGGGGLLGAERLENTSTEHQKITYRLEERAVRCEYYAQMPSPYAFMIGIRSSLTNLALGKCTKREGVVKALVQGACYQARNMHKRSVCIVAPVGNMAKILYKWSEDTQYPVDRVQHGSPEYIGICQMFSRTMGGLRCCQVYLIHVEPLLTSECVGRSIGVYSKVGIE
jgi:hypothetical protein